LPADFRGKYFFRYSASELNLLPQTLRPHIEAAVNAVIAERDAPRYKAEVWASRSLADVLSALRQAERQVDILTTNLTSLSVGDFLNLLCERLTSQPTLRVRILTHDPESVFAKDRAEQLGFDARHFRDDLRRSADLIIATMAPFQRQCQVAFYDEFPTQITIRIDNAIYYTVVSGNTTGTK
jgi:hypothetical protein